MNNQDEAQKAHEQPEPNEENIANLHYQIWRLDPSRKDYQSAAADIYLSLHEQQPSIQYRIRYQQLTGTILQEPPPLTLPKVLTKGEDDLEKLLAQLDGWISELETETS